ncbi:MAG: YqaJ viral recombinase family nuclease [Mycobacteriaceae bacterium]
MKAVLLGQHEPNTPEWDAMRANGIGGSEIAAIVGLSPWQSRFSLWHLKRGTIDKQQVNAGMRWGTLLEPVICDHFASQRDMLDVLTAGTYRHHERAWQIANPDRLLWDDEFGHVGILEVKTASAFDAHEWGHGPEDIPPYYRCQVLWYLDTLELPVAHVAVLIGGSDYREYKIQHSPEEAKWLRDQGEAFWQTVVSGEAPGIDGSTATYEAVRKLHPEIDGETVEIDPDLHEWFQASKKAAEAAATEHIAAKATLLDAMGEARYAEVDGARVYRRQPNRSGVSLVSVPPFRADQTKEKSA